jgi:1,2-phenylacetyl-CoA epoxidase catalytic subunit
VSKRPEGTEQVAPGRGAHSEFLVENDDALAALVNLIAVMGSVSFLDDPLPSWTNVVAALALVGPAVNTVLEAVEHSRYEALARRAHRILDEERLTSAYAESLVRQIAYEERGRRLFQERVDELLPEMLCWFGPDGEEGIEALEAEGLISMGNEEMRQRYLDKVVPLLQECKIEIPIRHSESEKRWEYGELPWSEWNQLQRRLERPAQRSGV